MKMTSRNSKDSQTLCTLDELREVDTNAYNRGVTQIADLLETMFWEGSYFDLVRGFMDENGQPMLAACDSFDDWRVRPEGTMLIPAPLREMWQTR
jgi:hypothetical protein